MNRFTIAIDGPAAAGKGTISKAVAAALGYAHLDTGLLYRAVGAKTLLGIAPMQAAVELTSEDLQADGLRSANAAQRRPRLRLSQKCGPRFWISRGRLPVVRVGRFWMGAISEQ